MGVISCKLLERRSVENWKITLLKYNIKNIVTSLVLDFIDRDNKHRFSILFHFYYL